jgi:hypothetical protein
MSDVYALCEATFGKVKAAWSQELQSLERHYPAAELEFAFGQAKQRGAKDLSYVVGILRNRREEQPLPEEQPARLPCDGPCGKPTWINNMRVLRSTGLCSDCFERTQRGIDLDGANVDTVEWTLTPVARKVQAYWERVTA